MTDDVRLLGERQLSVAAFEPNRAAHRTNEPCQCPEQRRLARAVGASEHERLTGRDRERQTVDNAAAPALYDQVFSNELHRDEFPRMGDGATTEAFARNATATTWRVSLLPPII